MPANRLRGGKTGNIDESSVVTLTSARKGGVGEVSYDGTLQESVLNVLLKSISKVIGTIIKKIHKIMKKPKFENWSVS